MRRGYKVTLGIITIMIMITLTVGTSYSFYSVSDVQTNPNTVTTTCFELNFAEGTDKSYSLSRDGYAYPVDMATALNKTPYTFTVSNTCSTGQSIKYDVTMNTLTNPTSSLDISSLRYNLNSTTTASQFSTTYSMDATTKSENNVSASYLITSGTLAPGASQTYNLYMWIDSSACGTSCNDLMGKTFTGKVLVYAYM